VIWKKQRGRFGLNPKGYTERERVEIEDGGANSQPGRSLLWILRFCVKKVGKHPGEVLSGFERSKPGDLERVGGLLLLEDLNPVFVSEDDVFIEGGALFPVRLGPDPEINHSQKNLG